MLKTGVVYIGKPTIHLHELLSLALYLDAPIALSDEISYNICKNFSEIIPVYLLSKEFSFNFFLSGLNLLYTNLQPSEIAAFIQAHPEMNKLQIRHLIEEGIKITPAFKPSVFCSSFLHTKKYVPSDNEWVNLGPVGSLSYQKHKKTIRKILASFFPISPDTQFFVAQILQDSQDPCINSEDTLDQIYFLNLAFNGFDKPSSVIPAHGLLDAAIDMTKACICKKDTMALAALNHKKPFLFPEPLRGLYENLSPLTTILPKEMKNLVPLIDNYFEFETIDREDLIKKCYYQFFNHSSYPQ